MLTTKKSTKVLENGVIIQDRYPEWHSIAAVKESGAYFVAEGHKWSPDFRNPAAELAAARLFPPMSAHNVTTLPMEELLGLYGTATISDSVDSSGTTITAKLQKILVDAAKAQASDVKIIQADTITRVRIKVAGREFTSNMVISQGEGQQMIAAMFDARDEGTGDSTALTARFQSFSVSPGKATMRLPNGVVKLRGQKGFHELADGMGGHMVLRLFYDDKAQAETATLDKLGFDAETEAALAQARAKLSGGIIIAGATGDGKSTTLVRCLQTLYKEHGQKISIVTIEDPVEYRIIGDGIIQIPVKSAGDGEERTAAFRQALMHFVRINPDVGSISEIRDADAAKEVLQFVDTGHQVWTTIHGSTANGILFRLIEMGIPAAELCKPGSIELLMKQSLAPLLCPHCAMDLQDGLKDDNTAENLTEIIRQMRGLDMSLDEIRLRNIEGCEQCRKGGSDPVARQAWNGYTRQTAVAEIILPDEAYFNAVRQQDSFGARRQWLLPKPAGGLGGMPIDAKLTRLVLNGYLDPCDATRKGTDFTKIDPALLEIDPPGPGGAPATGALNGSSGMDCGNPATAPDPPGLPHDRCGE